jgi:tRNA-5-methyluridine54 2-sulfurtransferase
MRQHKLALCKEHYLEWIPEQTERFIKKYKMFSREEKVIVAVSGGKDSLSLWDILVRLGYKADGLYIGLGIDGGHGSGILRYARIGVRSAWGQVPQSQGSR